MVLNETDSEGCDKINNRSFFVRKTGIFGKIDISFATGIRFARVSPF